MSLPPLLDGSAPLEWERRRMLASLESAGVIPWTTRSSGEPAMYGSEAWSAFTGQPLAERAAWGWVDMVHPEDRERVRASWLQAVTEEKPIWSEFRLRRADQTYAHVVSRGVPIRDASGTIREWAGCTVDISMQRLAEERYRERTEELKAVHAQLLERERLAAVGKMAAVVAHEIRNPLGAIFNVLSALRKQDDPLLRIVDEESQRINRIVGDLVDFARPSAPELADVSIQAILQEAARTAVQATPDARIDIEWHLDPEVDLVRADHRLLVRLFTNIALNAAQAMPTGGRLTIRTRRSGPQPGDVSISVSDTGCGVPVETHEKIFEPFFTTKATGNGLGLPVARQIAELHHGTLVLEPGSQTGCTFTLRLGVVVPDSPTSQASLSNK